MAVGERVQVQERAGPVRCGLCHADAVGEVVTCGGCGATHHGECLRELGACGTIGCPSQDRAAARLRVEPGAPLRCCPRDRPWQGASGVVACAGCGGRWHGACLGRATCCPDHPVLPEQRPRLRDAGPRVGSPRQCACGATFLVRPRDRYSPHCEGCKAWYGRVGVALVVGLPFVWVLLTVLLG